MTAFVKRLGRAAGCESRRETPPMIPSRIANVHLSNLPTLRHQPKDYFISRFVRQLRVQWFPCCCPNIIRRTASIPKQRRLGFTPRRKDAKTWRKTRPRPRLISRESSQNLESRRMALTLLLRVDRQKATMRPLWTRVSSCNPFLILTQG